MKAKIFCGPARSGKTKKAMKIREKVGRDKTVVIPGRNKKLFENPFLFQHINESTELVIIDDVPADFNWDYIYHWIASSRINQNEIVARLHVNRPMKPATVIEVPQMIITTNKTKFEDKDCASFRARVDLVRFPGRFWRFLNRIFPFLRKFPETSIQ